MINSFDININSTCPTFIYSIFAMSSTLDLQESLMSFAISYSTVALKMLLICVECLSSFGKMSKCDTEE